MTYSLLSRLFVFSGGWSVEVDRSIVRSLGQSDLVTGELPYTPQNRQQNDEQSTVWIKGRLIGSGQLGFNKWKEE